MMINTDDDFLVPPRFKRSLRKRWILFLCLLVLVAGVLIGYAISFSIHKKSPEISSVPYIKKCGNEVDYKGFHELIVNEISNKNIEENLRTLTKEPHIAGGKNSYSYAQNIAKQWRDFGIENVEIKQYNVLLSKPLRSGFFTITNTTNGTQMFTSHLNESTLIPSENYTRAPPFNAYSPSGICKGSLVYVNFGAMDDFSYLQKNNISLKGKIALVRYGVVFRGNKVKLAEKAGACGVILFSDPQNYATGTSTFPDSWWLPPDGTQRGTIYTSNGDPLTPGYPAIDGIHRINESEAILPKIPVHPVSYTDALQLLKILYGNDAPEGWQGGLNVTYKLTSPNNIEIALNVSVVNTPNTPIYNVIGKIVGSVEPDRIVALGNHHDAWVFGGVDPNSGTAVMLDIVRSMALAVKQGWKPRRTILFCSWDAEEYGLIGSNEWVEEHASMVSNQMVAYLNVDSAIEGNFTFTAASSSQIVGTLYNAAKQVKDPGGEGTVFDAWSKKMPDHNSPGFPSYTLPNSGTDFEAFFVKMGVPSFDLIYTFDKSAHPSVPSYPSYHSIHDNFYFVKNMLDRDFQYSASLAKIWSLTAARIADSIILPFDFEKYAQRLDICKKGIIEEYNRFFNRKQTLQFEKIIQSVKNFTNLASTFSEKIKTLDQSNELLVRMVNDQLMSVERAFLAPLGILNRPNIKHVVYGYSKYDSYLGNCMPALVDDMLEKKSGTSDLDNEKLDDRILEDMSQIYYHILQATSVLDVN